MLVFSGSGGGLTTSFAAALLAAHGYPSLALTDGALTSSGGTLAATQAAQADAHAKLLALLASK